MHRFYPFARPFLFALDPETAHDLAFAALDRAAALGLAQLFAPSAAPAPVTVMGIPFPNRVGLAAGLDKNAQHLAGLATFGFGFLEAGTVTPRPQPGNPKPRMFRLPRVNALINRLGFNNVGVANFLENLAESAYRSVLGVNIGRNFDTPNAKAADDYLFCLRAVYAKAHYVTVNVSSPNTQGLRELQSEDALAPLLSSLKTEQARLAQQHGRYVPLVVKISPDLPDNDLVAIARQLVAQQIDGVIATNTTIARDVIAEQHHAMEVGGLSGGPLRDKATHAIRQLARTLDGALPIIGVGGILSGEDAREKVAAGASLLQIYTGLIYRGPELVAECIDALTRP